MKYIEIDDIVIDLDEIASFYNSDSESSLLIYIKGNSKPFNLAMWDNTTREEYYNILKAYFKPLKISELKETIIWKNLIYTSK